MQIFSFNLIVFIITIYFDLSGYHVCRRVDLLSHWTNVSQTLSHEELLFQLWFRSFFYTLWN